MPNETAAAVASIQQIQTLLYSLTALGLTDYKYPQSATVLDGDFVDYLIVGGGTAGCVLGNRLSFDMNKTVLIIEAGVVPPVESQFSGLFPMFPKGIYDYNYKSEIDGRTALYQKNKYAPVTAGKMLGGSSGIDHTLYYTGRPGDFETMSKISNVSSLNYTNFLKYYKKVEKVFDELIMSEYGSYHGTEGLLKVTREPNTANKKIIDSYIEMGIDYMLDSNANQSCGVGEPFLTIFNNQRQSAADAYITPVKDRNNLKILLNATVIKINFDGTTATGVQVVTSTGEEITVNANIEVILSAGAIGTPHLLMLSGVGNADNLNENGISVISDLNVGANLIDHPFAVMAFAIEEANVSTESPNYGEIPLPVSCTYKSFENCSQMSQNLVINLLFTVNSSAFLQMCGHVYNIDNDICDKIYEASYTRNLYFAVTSVSHPVSRGNITLQSANYSTQPQINLGLYSDNEDLDNMARNLQDIYNILSTPYFTNVSAEMVDLEFSECSNYTMNSYDYWLCYAQCISSTSWQYSSTCSVGAVLDDNFKVKGVSGLRVCDASALPYTVSGFNKATVLALAELVSDIILSDASNE